MRLQNFRFLVIFFLGLCLSQKINAQDNAPIKLFFEKVYLHIDRNYYASGDDIWFKAYLVNAQSISPINTSNNLYVELINPINKIIWREVIRLDNGVGIGDFKLDDSIAGGSYRIRAYTNWMRNFGTHFIFEKQIIVKNIPGVDKKNKIDTKDKNDLIKALEGNLSQVIKTTSLFYKTQFFPEGGSMVEGISSLITFKSEDVNGNSADAAGVIVSSKRDTVVHFKTSYNGMGSFNFKPEAGVSYKAFVHYKNNPFAEADFPKALSGGLTMSITNTDSSKIIVNIFSDKLHPSNEITIAAKHGGRILYKEKMVLKDGRAIATITLKDFPMGIASITVYDQDLHPQCERLIYVENDHPLNISVTPGKNFYGSKEKATINISVTNDQKQPVKTFLSMAVIDDALDKPSDENIASNLLLQSEVSGKIENISEYFNKDNKQRKEQLDLLLRAQGWRTFLWRQMADTAIKLSYLPEPGITISGRVKEKFSKKPIPDMNITLQAPGAKGNKWYMTKTDQQGKYFLDGLPLYGTQTIKINSRNNKAKKGGQILMDTLFGNPLAVAADFAYETDSNFLKNFSSEAAKRYAIQKNNMWYHVLPGVTVTSKRRTLTLRDGTYMSFGYPENDFTITSEDYKYETLRDFLARKVPGAQYDVDNDGVTFIASGKSIRPRFTIDKREDVFEPDAPEGDDRPSVNRIDYYSIAMRNIISVSVRHYVGMPTYQRTTSASGRLDLGNSMTDIFMISLQLKPGAYNIDPAIISTEITGYYQARVFYSPNYQNLDNTKPDVRTTIHWDPLITTDANGKATVNFYNADPKTKIRVDVQGVTEKGIPVVAEIKYDVK